MSGNVVNLLKNKLHRLISKKHISEFGKGTVNKFSSTPYIYKGVRHPLRQMRI